MNAKSSKSENPEIWKFGNLKFVTFDENSIPSTYVCVVVISCIPYIPAGVKVRVIFSWTRNHRYGAEIAVRRLFRQKGTEII
jgi:hypothetical protein